MSLTRGGLGAALLLLFCRTEASAHYERCTIYQGKDTCLAGDTCTQQDGGIGICIPPPCQQDSDCTIAPLRQCDKRPTYPVCVECYSDSECSGGLLCELDPRSFVSNRCSECTVGRIGACTNNPKGHVCVYDRGGCGCNEHGDCEAKDFCRRNVCIPRPGGAGSKPPVDDDNSDGDAGVVSPSSIDAGVVTAFAPGPTASGSGCSAVGGESGVVLGVPLAVALLLLRRRRKATKASQAASSGRSGA